MMQVSASTSDQAPRTARSYAWVVFAITFGLLISDYMSRQVLNAVFPLLKSDWALTDKELGSLSGVVALMVGLLTFPLSLLADRFGRVKSLTLMAVLWSVATLACAIAQNYQHMLIARLCVGIGEAAYGSVGVAVVISVFPAHMRATIAGAFMAGGMFGSVLGVSLGGGLAQQFGWRWAFAAMACFGLVLAALYPLIVRQSRLSPTLKNENAKRPSLSTLFRSPSVICAYVGSGLQLFISGSLISWMPSYLNRYYAMDLDRAGAVSGIFVLIGGVGMIVCGMISDKLGRQSPALKLSLAILFCVMCFALLSAGFSMPPGSAQLVLIAAGMFVAAGTAGTGGAMVANLTPVAIHGTAFATLTLANNLLGLAPGPFVTGALADAWGLRAALIVIPTISLLAASAFALGKRYYEKDLQRIRGAIVA